MPESSPVASLEQPVPDAERKFWPPKFEQGWNENYVVERVALFPSY